MAAPIKNKGKVIGLWPWLFPTLITSLVGGLIWAVKTQAIQDDKIENIIREQATIHAELKIATGDIKTTTERIDRMDTPLSKRLLQLETSYDTRLQKVERESTNAQYMLATDRDLIENLAARVLTIDGQLKEIERNKR